MLYNLNYHCINADVLSWYVAFLAESMSPTSILTYIQAIVFMAKLKSIPIPDFSDVKIAHLLTGLKKSGRSVCVVREPVLVSHLVKMYFELQFRSIVDVQFWAACLLMFRALLRISNIVGVHALACDDVKYTSWGMLLSIRSAKCSTGSVHIIPIASINSVGLCAVSWLRLTLSIVLLVTFFLSYLTNCFSRSYVK